MVAAMTETLSRCSRSKTLVRKNKTDMKSCTSGWLVLTRNFVAGSHPQNDTLACKRENDSRLDSGEAPPARNGFVSFGF
jgi:hypothetical protein